MEVYVVRVLVFTFKNIVHFELTLCMMCEKRASLVVQLVKNSPAMQETEFDPWGKSSTSFSCLYSVFLVPLVKKIFPAPNCLDILSKFNCM